MKFFLRIALLVFLLTGTFGQDLGFDLGDALDDLEPTPEKPKEEPKAPEKPKTNDDLNLFDALGPDDPEPEKPKPPKKPAHGDGDLDLTNALGPDDPEPEKPKPPKKPASGDGNRFLDDSDLLDIGSDGEYKPDGGRSGGGGRAAGSDYNQNGGGESPQEAGSGTIAGIVSGIGVALLGAASSYFAYQKKKLCFKLQGGVDPEAGKGHQGTQSDPQVLSNLLRTS